MSLRMRIALGTVSTFNAILLGLLGLVALLYVDGAAGPIGAGALWLGSGGLLGLARWLRRGTEW